MAAQTSLEVYNTLKEKKDAIESEMTELLQVLETQGGVGLAGSLVDKDDFPRSDIDVYSVRHARHRVKCLQNDHKVLMRQIEDQLHTIHAEAREDKLNSGVEQMEVSETPAPTLKAFANVDRVDAGSPAAQASLKVGDQIARFGSITETNFVNLQTIGNVVQHSKGVGVAVTVLRDGAETRLTLTPQTWSGRGLLGCNIVPLKS